MHKVKITRAYLEVARLHGECELKFTTEDGGKLDWKGFVTPKTGPVIVEIPGDGQLSVEHSQLCSVSFEHLEDPTCGASV